MQIEILTSYLTPYIKLNFIWIVEVNNKTVSSWKKIRKYLHDLEVKILQMGCKIANHKISALLYQFGPEVPSQMTSIMPANRDFTFFLKRWEHSSFSNFQTTQRFGDTNSQSDKGWPMRDRRWIIRIQKTNSLILYPFKVLFQNSFSVPKHPVILSSWICWVISCVCCGL